MAAQSQETLLYGVIAVLALLAFGFFCYRFKKARKEAERGMQDAKGKYDKVWDDLVKRNECGIGDLAKLNADFGIAAEDWNEQVQRFGPRDSVCTVIGRKLHIHPADDFVELYKEAHKAQPKLLARADKWAKKHRGTREGDRVKDLKRALQKTFRSYGGDSRKLCDLARTTIVFDSFDNMTDCLATIQSEMKMYAKISKKEQNRFNPRYTDWGDDWGGNVDGYRDMQLRVGIDGHVCEIQMHFHPVYKLKDAETQNNYTKFRDLMAK